MNGAGPEVTASSERRGRWIAVAVVIASYLGMLLLTRTPVQGDTSLYAANVLARLHGPHSSLWEFGHVVWRPLTLVVFRALHPTMDPSDAVVFEQLVHVMTGIAVLGGVVALVAFQSWLARLDVPLWPATAAALALATASAFLGYAQTGSSYIPALAMLMLGLRAMAADDQTGDGRTIVAASIAFALSVLFWFPMVLAVPAAAVSALALRGDSGRRRRLAIAVSLLSGAMTLAVYAPVAYMANVRSLEGFQRWMSAASHNIVGIGGTPRVIIGFGRSLLNMDRLGLVTKRYLLHDPYNSTTAADVARAGLLRLALLYALLAFIAFALLRRESGRRVMLFFGLTALPVVGFAFRWQGGDLERYLALFPALFLAVAAYLATLQWRVQRVAGVALVLLLAAVNIPAISRWSMNRLCRTLTSRIESVPRTEGQPTVIITPHELDEITSYSAICPGSEVLKGSTAPRIYGLVTPNNRRAPRWRQQVATRAAGAWAAGGHLWVSRRALADAPDASSKWAEGDDPTVRWRDFPTLFQQLDTGAPVGGADGFVEILPTEKSKAALAPFQKPTS